MRQEERWGRGGIERGVPIFHALRKLDGIPLAEAGKICILIEPTRRMTMDELLSILKKNARTSLEDIARMTRSTPAAIAARI